MNLNAQDRRKWAEDHANEMVAAIYNIAFGRKKSWEDSYKEALIRTIEREYSIRNRYFNLMYKYNIVYKILFIESILLLGIIIGLILKGN